MSELRSRTESRVVRRDYSLTGPDAKAAIAAGFENADWYQVPIDPERLKVLMTRRNGRPTFDAILWAVLILGFGTLAFLSLGTWWAIPPSPPSARCGEVRPTHVGTRAGTARCSARPEPMTFCTASPRS